MELSKEEILKLDDILRFLNENRNISFENEYLPNHFQIPLEKFDFLYNEICNFSIYEYEVGAIKNIGTNYQKIYCDYRTDRFIANGGFEKYYKLKKERELKSEKPKINIENYIEGDINGVYLQCLEAKNIEIKQNNQPATNETNKDQKIASSKLLWGILIPLFFVILTALLTSERAMNFINKCVNKF